MTEATTTVDPPALRRLAQFDERWVRSDEVNKASSNGPRKMGYQPGLDGLRALSVIAVMLYHGGFTWMPGGFFGVEVFFVVSGYLITALLIDEREQQQRVSLEKFWLRRARRLLPALVTMLVSISIWAALFGSRAQQSVLKRDLPWSIFYAGNWGQITGKTPYFSPVDPSLVRHLWSLAVEEQWYLIWPVLFVVAMTIGAGTLRSRGYTFIGLSIGIMITTSALYGHVSTNALYLSTFTRASGLLLGAGSAFLWRPWRQGNASALMGRRLDPIGGAALAMIGCIMCAAVLTDSYVYRWTLALVSILSMIVIAAVVYPTSNGLRAILGWKPLVEIGRRSYGLYLWHWPIFVIGHVYHSGSWKRFVVGMLVTAAVTEVCYRYIETPIRKGFFGNWLRAQREAMGQDRVRRVRRTTSAVVASGGLALVLLIFFVSVDHYDPAVGGGNVQFAPTTTAATLTDLAPGESTPASVVAGAPANVAGLPRRMVVVGDSQAHSLAANLPDGIGSTFTIADGGIDGCGIYDEGDVITKRKGFVRSFGDCVGWQDKWAASAKASKAQIALVVIGGWDVFNLKLSSGTLVFTSPQADAYWLAQLQKGIDALKSTGAQVALLEVACFRPKDVSGAGVPALPERAQDWRTQHVNVLLEQAAAADPTHVSFVKGPTAWCQDKKISVDPKYRWDGVHVYKPGANLIYETITPALLALPVSP